MIFSRQLRRLLVAVAACCIPTVATAAYPTVLPGVSFDAVLSLPSREPAAVLRYGAAPVQFAELWLPEATQPAPVVVFIHGGCWLNEYGVDHSRPLATALAEAGYGAGDQGEREGGQP